MIWRRHAVLLTSILLVFYVCCSFSIFVALMHRSVGRPYMYGLAIGGSKGVEEVLRSILADTEITLGLSG